MTAKQKRASVIAQAKPALGRNVYSQDSAKRECVFVPYKDGRYYSDCSSFVRWLYRRALIYPNIGSNTDGIINSKLGAEIDCKIKSGVPTDISALRVGDVFLFRGNNKARTRYVGHVEIVAAIKGNSVTLMGHGSGHPKTHGMVSYCRLRQLWLVPGIIRNRGLICVKRFIPDDPNDVYDKVRVTGGSVNVRTGPGITNKAIAKAQEGDVLTRTFSDSEGWYGVRYNGASAYISKKYAEVLS